MSSTTKVFLGAVAIAAILGAFAFFGLTPFKQVVTKLIGTTTQGGTGSTARQYTVYGVNLAAPGASATTSSIYNGSGNDLFITHLIVGCEGVGTSKTAYTGAGLASLTVTAATSSSATALTGNAVGGAAITIATSTNTFVFASTTASGSGASSAKGYDIWPASTYLVFNTNATNTAVCTFGATVTSS